MNAEELRKKYIDFFVSKGHKEIPSASLVPENDPSVLFTTAGMHPLVPYLLGEKHPAGKRLVNVQRCIRTGDIDLVGDDHHLTFLEMLGNWSLGDATSPKGYDSAGYWKKEAIEWSFEFLTKKKWLGLDKNKIYISLYEGDKHNPKDTESEEMWASLGIPSDHIFFYGKQENWWGPVGETGPCGPDTEMFYFTGIDCPNGDNESCEPSCDCSRYVEIWNDVFMEYNKTGEDTYEPLQQKNVDTGMGLERTLQVVNGMKSVYETDVFSSLMDIIQNKAPSADATSTRVIADHIKAATMIIADGVQPSNLEAGYVVRRLIRRAYRYARKIDVDARSLVDCITTTISLYTGVYPGIAEKKSEIMDTYNIECEKFSRTLEKGLRILKKEIASNASIDSSIAFDLYQTYGFPKELIEEEADVKINEKEWKNEEKKHQEVSRKGSDQKFAGGLADHSPEVIKLHTATHLLHQALRDILGDNVQQKGSNITKKRTRFDFTHPEKMTDEQIKKVEEIVNKKINERIAIEKKKLPIEEAKKLGAIGLFGEKYDDVVSVYQIGDYSKEFCGGPHVKNTSELGTFRILKEESSSAGVRRIKAVLE